MPAPQYRHEYVSASVSMGPIITGAVWELTLWMTNRGYTTESFQVQLIRGVPSGESILSNPYAVDSLKAVGYGLGAEADPGIIAWEMWWARIFTTSLNLVPTLRFHVEDSAPPVPQFFFGPGDFAVFPYQVLPTSTGTTTGGGAGTA